MATHEASFGGQGLTTEAALDEAVREGLLEETHFVDIKRQLNSGPKANKELARDLAQFAIDSGNLVFGVDEQDDSTPQLTPLALAGLAERIEQVARTIPDPPLAVTCTAIPSAADPTTGYLWVHVPASGIGPHMVDSIYYGRGDKTRTRLSDSEVRRHHRLREIADDQIVLELDNYIARDPVPPDERQQAHLFVVAVPTTPRAEMLVDLAEGARRHEIATGLVTRGVDAVPLGSSFSPNIGETTGTFTYRADGIAFSYGLSANRSLDIDRHNSENAIEVEISDEGTVRVMTTRFSDEDRGGQQVLFEIMLPVLARQTISIAAEVADHASYGGGWLLGVAATGIAGLPAHLSGRWVLGRHAVGTDQDEYRQTTSCSTAELGSHPHDVAARLAGRFVRSLGLTDLDEVQELLNSPVEHAPPA